MSSDVTYVTLKYIKAWKTFGKNQTKKPARY